LELGDELHGKRDRRRLRHDAGVGDDSHDPEEGMVVEGELVGSGHHVG